ncbi:ABC transporter ATP-binding protein [Porphyromonas loveana]|uniref:ABC transporter ATP-binding protein n=1 Tax=Porphyromonas loveana TaxID=1884669 RepID=UPI0035A141EA
MIAIHDLSFRYEGLPIFSGLSYAFERGKYYSILGPSGCGKTTLLNLVSGLLTPTEGTIALGEADGTTAYMPQTDTLLPWRTVRENICLTFEVLGREVDEATINSYLRLYELADFAGYYPDKLSAGMKQRIALIQALISRPGVLLLDEPFSNLDFDIKLKIQAGIARELAPTETTTLMVTHDIEDAIVMSDHILILSDKPVRIKRCIPITFDGHKEKNPIELRKSHQLRDYFVEIWNELKYLG